MHLMPLSHGLTTTVCVCVCVCVYSCIDQEFAHVHCMCIYLLSDWVIVVCGIGMSVVGVCMHTWYDVLYLLVSVQ